jgi:hypothetical protein
LGGLLATLTDPELAGVRARLELGPSAHVLSLVTEGVTDPAVFERALS